MTYQVTGLIRPQSMVPVPAALAPPGEPAVVSTPINLGDLDAKRDMEGYAAEYRLKWTPTTSVFRNTPLCLCTRASQLFRPCPLPCSVGRQVPPRPSPSTGKLVAYPLDSRLDVTDTTFVAIGCRSLCIMPLAANPRWSWRPRRCLPIRWRRTPACRAPARLLSGRGWSTRAKLPGTPSNRGGPGSEPKGRVSPWARCATPNRPGPRSPAAGESVECRGQGGRSKGRASVLTVTVVFQNATPCSPQMAPRPGVTWVRLTGQFAGAENRSPAKVTCCHDDAIASEDPRASTTERGDQVSVCRTRWPRGPSTVISTPSDGTR